MSVHPNKLKRVISMSGAERFDYFVRKVADFDEVWGLHGKGWATATDEDGKVAVPFWPEADFAAECAVEEWDGYQPKSITLDDFLGKWLPGLLADQRLVAVFPTPASRGVLVEPDSVDSALRRELEEES